MTVLSGAACAALILALRAAAIHWNLSVPDWMMTHSKQDRSCGEVRQPLPRGCRPVGWRHGVGGKSVYILTADDTVNNSSGGLARSTALCGVILHVDNPKWRNALICHLALDVE